MYQHWLAIFHAVIAFVSVILAVVCIVYCYTLYSLVECVLL
jgi:hypothetical protein